MAEEGSAAALDLWLAARRRVSSRLLYPEARAAIARMVRARRLSQAMLPDARRRVGSLWEDVQRVEVTSAVGRRAGDLAERYGLRAYDAVHLASLLEVADPGVVLAAADGDLRRAARAAGLAVAAIP